MLPADAPGTSEGRTPADNATVRNVFIIGPDKKIKLVLVYPMTTGRNFQEILRVINSMQLTAKHKVATPADWKQGGDVIITGAVSNEEADKTVPRLQDPQAVSADHGAAQVVAANLLEKIGLEWPIFQAPMAGTSTPAMAAAVSNAGALGALRLAAEQPEGAGKMIAATKALTNRPFNVNVFCHRPAIPNAAVEAAWIARLKPEFTALGAEPPAALREIYQTFRGNAAMTALLLEARPAIVSFHFGLPREKPDHGAERGRHPPVRLRHQPGRSQTTGRCRHRRHRRAGLRGRRPSRHVRLCGA